MNEDYIYECLYCNYPLKADECHEGYCEACYDKYVFECDSCGNPITEHQSFGGMCESCYEDSEDEL